MNITFTNKWAKWLFWGAITAAAIIILMLVFKPNASITLGFGNPAPKQ